MKSLFRSLRNTASLVSGMVTTLLGSRAPVSAMLPSEGSSEVSMNRLFNPQSPLVIRIHAQLAHISKMGLPPVVGPIQTPTPLQIADLIEIPFRASLRQDDGRST